MVKLPIEGKGLQAIIRDTSHGVSDMAVENVPEGADRELFLEALKERASEFDKSGNLLDAFHLYRRVLRIDQSDMKALYNVATIYYSAGMTERAVECLHAILEVDPSQELAAENLEEIEGEGV